MKNANKDHPFPGLRPFEFEDRAFFFGREEQIQALYEKLLLNRFVAVVGSSGSGKSSLVKAGLLGRLLEARNPTIEEGWAIIVLRPLGHPLWQLAHAIATARIGGHADIDAEQQQRAIALATDRAVARLSRSSAELVELLRELHANDESRLLIIVDQFEELFRYGVTEPDVAFDERALFVKHLLGAAKAPDLRSHILITMRSEFIGDCAQFLELPEAINDSQFLTPRLTREQRKGSIVGPLGLAGGSIVPGLLQKLLNDMGREPDQLPVMQHALMRTWQEVFPSRMLTLEAYEAIGGMESAIAVHADGVLRELSELQKVDAEHLFRALTDLDKDGRATRRPSRFGDLAGLCSSPDSAATLIDSFRGDDCAFLSPNRGLPIEQDTVVDITHEALIRKWATLTGWVEREVEDSRIFLRLHELALRRKSDPEIILAPREAAERNRWWQARHPTPAWASRYLAKDDEIQFEDIRALLEASVLRAQRDAEYISSLERQTKEAQLEAERLLRERAEREVREKDRELQLAQMARKLAEAQRQKLVSQLPDRAESSSGHIYISHSDHDKRIAVEMYDWLVEQGVEDIFLDLDANHGDPKMIEGIRSSRVVLLLISTSWIDSRVCRQELEIAHFSGKELIPVLIDPVVPPKIPELEPQIAGLRIAKWSDGSAGKGLILANLRRLGMVAEFFQFEPGRRPYPGLVGFDERDAAVFFGRSTQIAEAIDRLRSFQSRGGSHVLVILGASGSGKSSFLRAGLWPRLRRDSASFFCLPILRPGGNRVDANSAFIGALREAAETEAKPDENRFGAPDELGATEQFDSRIEAVETRLVELSETLTQRLEGDQRRERVAIIFAIDQAEELFGPDYDHRSRSLLSSIGQLIQRSRVSIIVLLSIRSDSFEFVQADEYLGSLRKETFDLPPIPVSSLRSVIEGPARIAGLSLEPALVDALLEDLSGDRTKDALPLLSFTLERLYTEFGGRGSLNLADYKMLGGYSGAIEAAVERALRAADANPAIPRDRLARLALLRRGFVPWLAGIDPDTGAPRRRIARLSDIPGEARPLIQHLVEQRLLTTDVAKQTGEITIEPAHEALLRQWDLLQGWLAEDAGLLSVLEGVKRASRDWAANGRAAGWLTHRTGRLEVAERLTERSDFAANLDSTEREYLVTCRAAEATAKSRAWRVRALVYMLLVGMIIGLVGWINQSYVEEQMNWFLTVRPYVLTNIRPYVLTAADERALTPGKSFRECAKDCPEMIVIPAGEFTMGSPATEKGRNDDEGPQHQVTIGKPFGVSKFDVTFADWDACVSVGRCPQASDSGWGRGAMPVINIDWDSAQQYVAWLSMVTGRHYRLLTEAEWEYAARAGTATVYYWGDEIGGGKANCNGCGSSWDDKQTAPVGSFAPNRFGLYDMAGNVSQWVEDCNHGDYNGSPFDGSAWTSGSDCIQRVVRGGAWLDIPRHLRSAARVSNNAVSRTVGVGFRVARTLAP